MATVKALAVLLFVFGTQAGQRWPESESSTSVVDWSTWHVSHEVEAPVLTQPAGRHLGEEWFVKRAESPTTATTHTKKSSIKSTRTSTTHTKSTAAKTDTTKSPTTKSRTTKSITASTTPTTPPTNCPVASTCDNQIRCGADSTCICFGGFNGGTFCISPGICTACQFDTDCGPNQVCLDPSTTCCGFPSCGSLC